MKHVGYLSSTKPESWGAVVGDECKGRIKSGRENLSLPDSRRANLAHAGLLQSGISLELESLNAVSV